MRATIDLPPPLMRLTQVQWDIDWAGQGGGRDLAGGDQMVIGRFPRFTASLSLSFERDGIGHWRAFRARLQGRTNAVRLRLLDAVTMQTVGSALDNGWQAYLSGTYIEPRPQIRCLAPVAAGATTLQVDESLARAPVPIGAHLSFNDWPFQVVGRSGSGAAVTLDVLMLRTGIPANGMIDLVPRGLFLMDDPAEGAPRYGRSLRAAPDISLSEWITRT